MEKPHRMRLRPQMGRGRLLTAVFAAVLLAAAGLCAAENRPRPPGSQGREIETWSFHTRINGPHQTAPLHLGMFFVSGRLYFFKGHLTHVFWLKEAYGHESQVLMPPFKSVSHDRTQLNETFDGSTIKYSEKTGAIRVNADFSGIRARLTFQPEKPKVMFNQIFDKNQDNRIFDWYLLPRMQVKADISGQFDLKATGEGHFQHFWGDDVIEGGDFLMVHMDSGYDLIVSNVDTVAAEKPFMTSGYILVAPPEGERRVIREFSYTPGRWWQSGDTEKKYPVKVTVKSGDEAVCLDISAMRDDQAAMMVNVEKWFGYGVVEGTIDGVPMSGWAFMSMQAADDQAVTAEK